MYCVKCTLCTLCTLQVECEYDAVWTPKPLHGGTVMPRCIREWKQTNYFSFFKIFHPAINCTEPPFQVRNNDMGMYNWTGVDGEDPRPFATSIEYFCPREGWGYPRSDQKYFNPKIFQYIFEFMISGEEAILEIVGRQTISLSVRLFNIIHDVIML